MGRITARFNWHRQLALSFGCRQFDQMAPKRAPPPPSEYTKKYAPEVEEALSQALDVTFAARPAASKVLAAVGLQQ